MAILLNCKIVLKTNKFDCHSLATCMAEIPKTLKISRFCFFKPRSSLSILPVAHGIEALGMLKRNWMAEWPHMTARAIRSSLITKIFVICFISIHVPLLAVVAHVLGGGALSEASILLVLLISTLAGTAGCLLSLWRIIQPLRQLNHSIARYRQEGAPVTIAVKTKDEIGTVAQAVSALVTELDCSLKTLTLQANTDPLTGLANRRFILARGTEALDETRRNGDPMCLLLFDLDHFKGINDAFGHETGDKALIAAAQTIRSNLRPNDLAGRIGGEEFCVLLPGTNLVRPKRLPNVYALAWKIFVLNHWHLAGSPPALALPNPPIIFQLSRNSWPPPIWRSTAPNNMAATASTANLKTPSAICDKKAATRPQHFCHRASIGLGSP